MALIRCPQCSRRISTLMKVCPHCDTALGELSPEDQERLARRHWKRMLYRALNLSYLGLTLLVTGAIWWWFSGTQGCVLPPPLPAVSLIILGAAVYLVARAWILWLRIKGKPLRT